VFGSCFRTLTAILGTDFFSKKMKKENGDQIAGFVDGRFWVSRSLGRLSQYLTKRLQLAFRHVELSSSCGMLNCAN